MTTTQAVEVEEATVKTLTRCVRIELAKPLDCTWDEAGLVLRTRQAVMHSLLNAGCVGILVAEKLGNKPKALEAIHEELVRVKEYHAGRADKVQATLTALAAQAPKKVLAEEEARQKKIGWLTRDVRELRAIADLTLASAITDALQQRCRQAVMRWHKDGMRSRVPSAKADGPIFVRDGASAWELVAGKKGFELGVRLKEGRVGKSRFAIVASSGKHWRALGAIAKHEVKAGDLKLVRDGHKWFGIISYTEPAPEAAKVDPKKTLVIHRGVRNAITMVDSEGGIRQVRGGKVMAQRRALEARARDVRKTSAGERGAGAQGHGTGRRYVTHDALEDKIDRVMKTACQQWASLVAKRALEVGAGRILIEDYGGLPPDEDKAKRRVLSRFPLYRLKQSIAWSLKKVGIELEEIRCDYVSEECPRCGHCEPGNHNVRSNVLHCRRCNEHRDSDFVAALLMLRRAQPDHNRWDDLLEEQRKFAISVKESVSSEKGK